MTSARKKAVVVGAIGALDVVSLVVFGAVLHLI